MWKKAIAIKKAVARKSVTVLVWHFVIVYLYGTAVSCWIWMEHFTRCFVFRLNRLMLSFWRVWLTLDLNKKILWIIKIKKKWHKEVMVTVYKNGMVLAIWPCADYSTWSGHWGRRRHSRAIKFLDYCLISCLLRLAYCAALTVSWQL